MKRQIAALLSVLPGLYLMFWANTLHAADVQNGRNLHDQNCLHCHDTSVYTRENHRIKTLAELRKQVLRCELSLELQWFEEDVDDVVAFLNTTYYMFKK
ncbi:MAG: cytochrome c [Gammaproteobacteria bacterium]